MARQKTYPDILELLIRCFGMPEEDARERLRRSRAPQIVRSLYEISRKNAKEKAKVFENYQKLQMEMHQREGAAAGLTQEDLSKELCVTVAEQFLARVETSGEEDCTIPGFEGHGAEAAREMLKELDELLDSEPDVQAQAGN